MLQRLAGILVVIAILASGAVCKKMGEPGDGEQKLSVEELPRADSIPKEWGKLLSVSSIPGVEKWAQLWFEDDEGDIRLVPYNVESNYLSKQARVIRRD